MEASARVGHAPRARRRAVGRHPALRARDGSRRQGPGGDIAAVVSTRRHAVHRSCQRSSSATPSAAEQPPPRRCASACSTIAWQRRAEYAFVAAPLAESVAAAKRLGNAPQDGPVLLIDHCDNCGSGGAQDVMAVVAEILRQELDDVAIAPIRDPAAVAQMIAAGVGNRITLDLGGRTDMPSIGRQGRAADYFRPRARDHRRRVHHHRTDVYRHQDFSGSHRRAWC